MRTVYTLIIGLVMFNAFLVLFGPFFSISDASVNNAVPIEDMSSYKPTDAPGLLLQIFSFGNTWSGVASAGIITIILFSVALLTKNYIYIGVAIFLGLVIGLYTQTSSVLFSIASGPLNDQYGIVQGIFTITAVALGILIAFAVVDMFAPTPTR